MNQQVPFDESSLLFVKPSFSRGLARVVAPYGRLLSFNYSGSGKEADVRAIRSDWRAVGHGLLSALVDCDSKKTVVF